MKQILSISALIAAQAGAVVGAAQLINGNWYDQQVEQIVYENWGSAGAYEQVMDMSNGKCVKSPVNFEGGMAPLNGEVSVHFRGPMHLKQFAYYTPGTSSKKRDIKPSVHQKRHNHAHLHQGRGVGDWVTATIDGQVVSWINEWSGQPTQISEDEILISTSTASKVSTSPIPEADPTAKAQSNAGAGNWGRQAYYSAVDGVADGLVFLNNHGGDGSGVFDTTMGASLSYASSDSQRGSASPQVLADVFLPDNTEVAIYSDQPCEGDSCGHYRPESVAYHGFDGASKLFLMEFDMPLTGNKGFNADMPAVWLLNALIARTQQYGDCSCWPNCGEWDVFETLDSGNTKVKTCVHGPSTASGGDNNYFDRPTNKTVKAAVVFDGPSSAGRIVVLPDETNFAEVIADDVVAGFGKIDTSLSKSLGKSAVRLASSVFKLGS